MSDDYDDFEDIFDKIKKFFNLNSRLFDMDFYIFPEFTKNLDPKKRGSKGFKVSYHFEEGMDEPDVKVEGDIDEKDLHDILNNADVHKLPKFKVLKRPEKNKLIDATELLLEPEEHEINVKAKEPLTEICDYSDCTEIIIEVPGIKKEQISIDFNKEGNRIKFKATNLDRHYQKEIELPFKSSDERYELDVNNGIATLRVWRDKR